MPEHSALGVKLKDKRITTGQKEIRTEHRFTILPRGSGLQNSARLKASGLICMHCIPLAGLSWGGCRITSFL